MLSDRTAPEGVVAPSPYLLYQFPEGVTRWSLDLFEAARV